MPKVPEVPELPKVPGMPGGPNVLTDCEASSEVSVADAIQDTKEALMSACKGEHETEEGAAEIEAAKGEQLAVEMNKTEGLYDMSSKIRKSMKAKFNAKRARGQAPTFGTLTALAGVVGSCVLLAVAAGGYAFGVHRQRTAITNYDEKELLEMGDENQVE
eukprot:gnl/TRDRNA2_/TRDRNA2_61030_c0_seq1.p1 gnl/TRDRNA2_/TRDRNA2_61030_c0~~gnl/TRDRNA2_/TRDRNA2_61030_c0_seq1.p1  ORF type:complete len:160 (-),score=51.38 gnl/TRDRNA2_/TRDRNA2_61030_c0_seq1:192-671(-)